MSGEAQDRTHHEIDYIEFGARDMQASRRFFEQAFDWSFTEYGDAYFGIRKSGGGEMGGLRQVDAVQRGGPLVILYSKDIEASLVAVKKAGGEITEEIFAFPGGRRFQFRDPAGNELAVWTDSGGLELPT